MSHSDQLGADARSWAEDLRPASANRHEALVELEGLLLRAARFELARRRAAVPDLTAGDQLARAAAASALIAVLGDLDRYRGQSRFSTWAYKFALHEAAIRCRRQSRQDHNLEGAQQ